MTIASKQPWAERREAAMKKAREQAIDRERVIDETLTAVETAVEQREAASDPVTTPPPSYTSPQSNLQNLMGQAFTRLGEQTIAELQKLREELAAEFKKNQDNFDELDEFIATTQTEVRSRTVSAQMQADAASVWIVETGQRAQQLLSELFNIERPKIEDAKPVLPKPLSFLKRSEPDTDSQQ